MKISQSIANKILKLVDKPVTRSMILEKFPFKREEAWDTLDFLVTIGKIKLKNKRYELCS